MTVRLLYTATPRWHGPISTDRAEALHAPVMQNLEDSIVDSWTPVKPLPALTSIERDHITLASCSLPNSTPVHFSLIPLICAVFPAVSCLRGPKATHVGQRSKHNAAISSKANAASAGVKTA